MHVPFTYYLYWPEHDMKYYGVRYAQGCHPNDLWTTYFTSSEKVAEFVNQYGDPSVKQIRRTFDHLPDPVSAARLWESKVLKYLNVRNRNDYLNRNERMAPPILSGDLSPMRRPEVVDKFKKTRKKRGIKRTQEQKDYHSKIMRGRPQDPEIVEYRRQCIIALGERSPNKRPERRAQSAKAWTGHNNPSSRKDLKKTCSHCHTSYSPNNARYHEDNCRQNPANKNRDYSRPKTPCKYCGLLCAYNQLPRHEKKCAHKQLNK